MTTSNYPEGIVGGVPKAQCSMQPCVAAIHQVECSGAAPLVRGSWGALGVAHALWKGGGSSKL